MTKLEFEAQADRLSNQWLYSFASERRNLLYELVKDQSREWLKSTVSGFLSDRRVAPTVSDFRDVILRMNKRKLDEDTAGALKTWSSIKDGSVTPTGLSRYLESVGAKNLVEAVNMERRRIRAEDLAKAQDKGSSL